MNKTVTVEDILNRLSLDTIYGYEHIDNVVDTSEVSRPGLALAEDIDFYPNGRVQIIGKTEMNYINSKRPDEREVILERICNERTPAIVIARGMDIPQELFPLSDKYHVPLLSTKSKTSRALANITNFLEGELAERISRHGVFVEVFGMGILLVGDSGVGKSETALELVQRGHRLIADDRVEFFQIDELNIIGEAPEILKNLIEIRGLGIIDIMHLYGVAAIRSSKRLELIIELVVDDGSEYYERLGFEKEYEQIMDVEIPKIYLPVRVGRNLSAIIESAAMDHRANSMGYNARETFRNQLQALIQRNSENDKKPKKKSRKIFRGEKHD